MSKPISLAGIAMMGAGSLLVYGGIKGYSVLTAIQNLITGQPIGVNSQISSLTTPAEGIGEAPAVEGVAPSSGSPRVMGKYMASLYGWTGAEWDALDKLWTQESSWNPHAENSKSHAYGIPQSLPWTKMPKAAWPERAGGTSDMTTQIQWGLTYIKGRYGWPSVAWAHETANSWY